MLSVIMEANHSMIGGCKGTHTYSLSKKKLFKSSTRPCGLPIAKTWCCTENDVCTPRQRRYRKL